MSDTAGSVSRTNLRKILRKSFSEGDLRDLCQDLDIDYDDLPGEGKADKVRELIIFCDQRGRLSELLSKCQELRPDIPWSERLPSTATPPSTAGQILDKLHLTLGSHRGLWIAVAGTLFIIVAMAVTFGIVVPARQAKSATLTVQAQTATAESELTTAAGRDTPTPTVTSTPDTLPTVTVTPTVTPMPSPTPTVTKIPSPTTSPTPTTAPTPTAAPTFTPTPDPDDLTCDPEIVQAIRNACYAQEQYLLGEISADELCEAWGGNDKAQGQAEKVTTHANATVEITEVNWEIDECSIIQPFSKYVVVRVKEYWEYAATLQCSSGSELESTRTESSDLQIYGLGWDGGRGEWIVKDWYTGPILIDDYMDCGQ